MNKNVIITGACGFIGSNLSIFLSKHGYSVTKLDIVESDSVTLVDYNNIDNISSIIKNVSPSIIINCAGSADVQKSFDNPEHDYRCNVELVKLLLDAIIRSKLNNIRFVQLSSAAVYGQPSSIPIKETCAVNPISPYAKNKLLSEEICMEYYKKYNIDIKIARIFSAYGPGLKKQIFWDLYHKYKNNNKIELFGDGTESRDFIYIEDLSNALYLISTKKFSDLIINVANGEEITIKHLAFLFTKNLNIDESNVFFNKKERRGDPSNWKADIKILTKLGYKKNTSLDQGIFNYLNWIKRINN